MRTYTLDRLEVTLSELLMCHFHGLPIQQIMIDRYRPVLAQANALLKPVAGVELITNYMFKELMHSVKELAPKTHTKLGPLQRSSISTYLIFCTIGPHLDDEVDRLCAEDDISTAFILDAVGSIAVVKFAKYLELLLSKEAALRGHKCSVPIMPGTRGIDLAVNRALVEAVDIKQIGIALSDQCILKPLKTMAMILGVGGSRLTAGAAGHNCRTCSSEEICYLKHIRQAIDQSPFSCDAVQDTQHSSSDKDYA